MRRIRRIAPTRQGRYQSPEIQNHGTHGTHGRNGRAEALAGRGEQRNDASHSQSSRHSRLKTGNRELGECDECLCCGIARSATAVVSRQSLLFVPSVPSVSAVFSVVLPRGQKCARSKALKPLSYRSLEVDSSRRWSPEEVEPRGGGTPRRWNPRIRFDRPASA